MSENDRPRHRAISLSDLRVANTERQAEWCHDQVPDLSFRGNELGGECGEAQNVIKKLERERHGWRGSRATIDDLAQELADVVICADLCAMAVNIDLASAVVAKFNADSEKNGLFTRLKIAPDYGEMTDPVLRERAACAHLAECHTGMWDNATAENIAESIRARGPGADDFVLATREAWAVVQPVWMLLRYGKPLPEDLKQRLASAMLEGPADG